MCVCVGGVSIKSTGNRVTSFSHIMQKLFQTCEILSAVNTFNGNKNKLRTAAQSFGEVLSQNKSTTKGLANRGRTVLIMKDPYKAVTPSNYWPITCRFITGKLHSGITAEVQSTSCWYNR